MKVMIRIHLGHIKELEHLKGLPDESSLMDLRKGYEL